MIIVVLLTGLVWYFLPVFKVRRWSFPKLFKGKENYFLYDLGLAKRLKSNLTGRMSPLINSFHDRDPWFLYDADLCHEKVHLIFMTLSKFILWFGFISLIHLMSLVFLYPWFSDAFRGYQRRPVTWNELISFVFRF